MGADGTGWSRSKEDMAGWRKKKKQMEMDNDNQLAW